MLLLNSIKHFSADDRFMIIRNEVLRQLTPIPSVDLGNVVGDKILLKQQVADIFLILEHALDCRCYPFTAKAGRHAFLK